MDIKKLVIGGIAGGVLYFLLGWLVYGTLLADFMKTHPGAVSGFDRPSPDFTYLVIGNVLSGFLLAYIFVKGNVGSLVNGFITGAVIGILMAAAFDTINYGLTFLISKKVMLADVLASGIISAITGAVIAVLMGKPKTS
ncbi:MAG: hypothetical protein JST86_04780 [Bacteroidetes bacterium]|nr:hypothetical protein [Bacteroidota bacterium]